MQHLSNEELIKKAISNIKIKIINDERKIGDASCVLITDKGNLYIGLNIAGHVGICSEQAACGAMVTAGEYNILKIVTVRKENNEISVIPPCGRCREFLTKINEENMETEVILNISSSIKLKDLLTHHKEYNILPQEYLP